VHDVWVRERPGEPWRFSLMLDERDGADWVYRRDGRVRRPVDACTRVRDGVRWLEPEIQLLYKSKGRRPQDELDLARTLPHLDAGRRRWLDAALAVADPGNPWRGVVRGD
jgi:hypothetical protein